MWCSLFTPLCNTAYSHNLTFFFSAIISAFEAREKMMFLCVLVCHYFSALISQRPLWRIWRSIMWKIRKMWGSFFFFLLQTHPRALWQRGCFFPFMSLVFSEFGSKINVIDGCLSWVRTESFSNNLIFESEGSHIKIHGGGMVVEILIKQIKTFAAVNPLTSTRPKS